MLSFLPTPARPRPAHPPARPAPGGAGRVFCPRPGAGGRQGVAAAATPGPGGGGEAGQQRAGRVTQAASTSAIFSPPAHRPDNTMAPQVRGGGAEDARLRPPQAAGSIVLLRLGVGARNAEGLPGCARPGREGGMGGGGGRLAPLALPTPTLPPSCPPLPSPLPPPLSPHPPHPATPSPPLYPLFPPPPSPFSSPSSASTPSPRRPAPPAQKT